MQQHQNDTTVCGGVVRQLSRMEAVDQNELLTAGLVGLDIKAAADFERLFGRPQVFQGIGIGAGMRLQVLVAALERVFIE
jgi:hypothetical protein